MKPSSAVQTSPPNAAADVRANAAATAKANARGLLLARPGRPRTPLDADAAKGRHALQLGGSRDGFLYVPKGVSATEKTPLVVFFHGAGGNADQSEMIRSLADKHHVLVLAIDSRASTWDVIHDEIGPDVAFLDRALAWTFDRFTVDPSRLAASGFSDGASYALSLALANGELFENVLAFSPGFTAAPEVHGKPRFFISHGTKDGVLPIDPCSRRIVPRLQRAGYTVEYREFDGPHTVPADIARDAFVWLLG